jgi:HD-GYP domain-containing protein (c-di-GMP phosphodiesterase class II)
LAVADAFDAMIHDRPYRKAMSREKAMAELKRNAGTQFDPDVVSVATKLDTFRNVKIS